VNAISRLVRSAARGDRGRDRTRARSGAARRWAIPGAKFKRRTRA